ncbi:arsenate reductase ArsC [Nocardia terpenica]|uniref:Phosphotyrosine protein phosphatase n=1 Tax=Nocardia terpenica TaxID=455432 RepID=A0A164HM95_9NOCA|nr:phosphotyrosine protein phosphatase [Nocardia terpenica]MBF6062536.1 arsenate reductase ArsC [Nocardia terpenica]MBF6104624.1 arsenate reductase ArsC [Nocardia terpenica]MBF6109521.1 arsenate reductase ArsC [Nocardia terpenica]MBF6123709.1 arsenate reductase ArsC [Nocardia terpenica]
MCVSQPEHPSRAGYAAITPAYRLLDVDHDTALAHAERRLNAEFAILFDSGTIHRFLSSSYTEYTGRAKVTWYLPLLAERFARQRLHALAKVQGRIPQPKPVVLFLCTHNAGRSQMALGFFIRDVGGRALAWSGGSEPSGSLNPAVVAAMAEIGIDISYEFPKTWTDEIILAADVIVTMGCADTCPLVPGPRYEDWIVDDPAGLPVAQIRPIRDEIGRRVVLLLDSLDLDVAAT